MQWKSNSKCVAKWKVLSWNLLSTQNTLKIRGVNELFSLEIDKAKEKDKEWERKYYSKAVARSHSLYKQQKGLLNMGRSDIFYFLLFCCCIQLFIWILLSCSCLCCFILRRNTYLLWWTCWHVGERFKYIFPLMFFIQKHVRPSAIQNENKQLSHTIFVCI